MHDAGTFDYLELPDCGAQTVEIARRLSPHYHCVFAPFRDEGQIETYARAGFYCRSSFTAQDLPLHGRGGAGECLARLPAERRDDILSGVRRAEARGLGVEVDVLRGRREDFRAVYEWYFEVLRPSAATHFPNARQYRFVEDFNEDLLTRDGDNPFVFAAARAGDQIVGGALLRHLPAALYRRQSSFAAAFPDAPDAGPVLQMHLLDSGAGPAGNVNAFLYHSIIDWGARQGYGFFSFGREDLTLPPREQLNVVGAKRAWGTTTVLESGAGTQFVLCNRAALLHLDADYFVFHREPGAHYLRYFLNADVVPQALSRWLEGDAYLRKFVYTRSRETFSHLEKRAPRWNKTTLVLCGADGAEEAAAACP